MLVSCRYVFSKVSRKISCIMFDVSNRPGIFSFICSISFSGSLPVSGAFKNTSSLLLSFSPF